VIAKSSGAEEELPDSVVLASPSPSPSAAPEPDEELEEEISDPESESSTPLSFELIPGV
jgi:hypothetical protein